MSVCVEYVKDMKRKHRTGDGQFSRFTVFHFLSISCILAHSKGIREIHVIIFIDHYQSILHVNS